MKKVLALLITIFLSTACDDPRFERLQGLYQEQCSEAGTINLKSINKDSTCNGVPLLVSLVRSDDYRLEGNTAKVMEFLVDQHGFTLNFMTNKSLSLLQEAVIEKKNDAIEFILQEELPFISEKNTTNSILHTVIKHSEHLPLDMIRAIVTRFNGAIDSPDLSGKSPVELAYEYKLGSIVFSLINKGADESFILDKIMNREIAPQLLFVPEIAKAKELIELLAPAIDWSYDFKKVKGYTLAHYGAQLNDVSMLKQLSSLGANFFSKSSVGTPIEVAARLGSKEAAIYLADIKAYGFGNEIINFALKNKEYELAALLANRGIRPGSYSDLIGLDLKENRYAQFLTQYLQFNFNYLNEKVIAPVNEIVNWSRSFKIANSGNSIMFTYMALPMYIKTKVKDKRIAFLRRTANRAWQNWALLDESYSKNNLGQSLLSFALATYKASKRFVNHNAIITSSLLRDHWGIVDLLGMVPLNYAFLSKDKMPSVSELKSFIKLGADVNHINSLGETILHMVVRHGEYDLAKYLLSGTFFHGYSGFDKENLINVVNTKGESALSLAKKSSSKKLVELIKNNGGR